MAMKDIQDWQVCKAYELAHAGSWLQPQAILCSMTGEPLKVCWAAIERTSLRGYIEYGVSLRSGWLTDKGKELLSSAS